MAMLMVDGYPIAEIDANTANLLKGLAAARTGLLITTPEISPGRPQVRDLGPLAGGTLMRREYEQDCEVSLSIRFFERSEHIERTVAP